MKKYIPAFIILTVAIAITLSPKELTTKVAALLGFHKTETSNTAMPKKPDYIQATGFEYAELIRQNTAGTKVFTGVTETSLGITSHHLPTAADLISSLYKTLQKTKGPRATFVVIGPDHTERCKNFISTTDRPYQTPFGELPSDTDMVRKLVQNGVSLNNTCFEGEHSIGIQALYIKYLFPEARIVPITLSSATSDKDIQFLVGQLAPFKNDITVVVSVDFSHYRTTQIANQLDAESARMIKNLNGSGLTLEHMDSPPSIKAAIGLAKAWGLEPQMLRHANSFEFTGQPENTTGYWDVLFTPTENQTKHKN